MPTRDPDVRRHHRRHHVLETAVPGLRNASPAAKVLLAVVLFATAGEAAETRRTETSERQEVSRRGLDGVRPRAVGLTASLRSTLREGWALARERLRTSASCRALFEELGADGLRALDASVYAAAEARFEGTFCARRASAFTTVGGPVTRLCRSFRRLAPPVAAGVVVHEALHAAGLGESPSTPGALSPAEIDDRVAAACGTFEPGIESVVDDAGERPVRAR